MFWLQRLELKLNGKTWFFVASGNGLYINVYEWKSKRTEIPVPLYGVCHNNVPPVLQVCVTFLCNDNRKNNAY